MGESNNTTPFLISLSGILGDYITTAFGLRLGFNEMNLKYHPVCALCVFWGSLALLTVTLPKNKFSERGKNIFAALSFLGLFNNTLVIFGIFSGLII